jgi:hypothetical protein
MNYRLTSLLRYPNKKNHDIAKHIQLNYKENIVSYDYGTDQPLEIVIFFVT